MSFKLVEDSDFRIKQLTLETSSDTIDITLSFDELNIFENVMMPCMSGNIFIRDTNNMVNKIGISKTKLIIEIEKGKDNPELFNFLKTFTVYKITNKQNVGLGVQTFILHFVSEEFYKSEHKKNNFRYKGLYSDAIKKILIDDLGIDPKRIPTESTPTTSGFVQTIGIHDIIVPSMTPFEAIDWISRRSIPKSQNSQIPDCLFFESKDKFYFNSIGDLSQLEPIFKEGIRIRPKNISTNQESGSELLDAINYKVLQTSNIAKNVKNGVYAGKFFGWDTLVRLQKTVKYDFYYFWNRSNHFNRYPIIPKDEEEELIKNYDSRIVVYPFASERRNVEYVKKENNVDAAIIDNTDEYVLQRKMVIQNLMQRRVRLTMPGNFGLVAGSVIDLNFPSFESQKQGVESLDEALTGKYLITAVRHIIRFDRHETVIETATDSTNSENQL